MKIFDFRKMKTEKTPISMITCYDSWSAEIIASSSVDCILVGDSLSMIMYGHETTISATTDLIAQHVKAVRKGAPDTFIVADMPFLSFRKGFDCAMNAVETLMQAGANAIKLEGIQGHDEIVRHIVESGVPVMGHLGLTPQSVHQIGGFKVQGQEEASIKKLLQDSRLIEEAGCFALVLECIPASVAQQITESLNIPTIGIGAGQACDGQVLVLQDMLGLNKGFKPKFLRTYLNGFDLFKSALDNYDKDVKSRTFPSQKESYS